MRSATTSAYWALETLPQATLGHCLPPTPEGQWLDTEAQITAEIEAGITQAEILFDEEVLRSTVEAEYGPSAFEEMERSREELVKRASFLFVRGYARMRYLIGSINAYNFASHYLQSDGVKPPPRRRGKADPDRDARLAEKSDAAPLGKKEKVIATSAGVKTEQELNATKRRLERDAEKRAAQQARIKAMLDKIGRAEVREWLSRGDK